MFVGRWLLIVVCSVLVDVCCFGVCWLLFVVWWLLFGVCCLLFDGWWLLFVVCCLLCAVCCLLIDR